MGNKKKYYREEHIDIPVQLKKKEPKCIQMEIKGKRICTSLVLLHPAQKANSFSLFYVLSFLIENMTNFLSIDLKEGISKMKCVPSRIAWKGGQSLKRTKKKLGNYDEGGCVTWKSWGRISTKQIYSLWKKLLFLGKNY